MSMDEDDQGLLSEPPRRPVGLRPSQATRRKLTTRPSPWPASPMDLDDLLSEILLRLPPLPSSLPRASLVCAGWRRLVTDPSFICRFRAHHWRPLGVFFGSGEDLSFSFISDPAYPILPERFSVRVLRDVFERYTWELHGCRHGRVVLAHRGRSGHVIFQFLVWNPLTGEAHFLDISQFLDPVRNQNGSYMKGAVIGASGDKGPFKFVLAWNEIHHRIAHICVYSSETGVWGDVISTAVEPLSSVGYGNVLVGHTLYWILFGHQVHILQFDLGSQNLAVIEGPPVEEDHWGIFLCTLGKGGGLSLIVMSANLKAQLWLWETSSDSDGVARWMHGGTIELDKLLSLRSGEYQQVLWLAGDDNVMFVSTNRAVFMVDLESMQFQKIFETSIVTNQCIHPFKNQYAQDVDHRSVANVEVIMPVPEIEAVPPEFGPLESVEKRRKQLPQVLSWQTAAWDQYLFYD